MTLRLTEDELLWVSSEVLRRGLVSRGRPSRSAWWRKAIEAWCDADEPDLAVETTKPRNTEGCSVALETRHIAALDRAVVRWSRPDLFLDRSVVARALVRAAREGHVSITDASQQE